LGDNFEDNKSVDEQDYTGFGLSYLRQEGAAMHPDDTEREMNDAYYLRQLQAYVDSHGIDETKKSYCSRPHLLEKLTEKE